MESGQGKASGITEKAGVIMERMYLVTGGAGHLGTAVIEKLRGTGDEIRALCIPGEKNPPKGVEVYYGDVRDKGSLRGFFENPGKKYSVLVHCAGIVSISSKYVQNVYEVNVNGTKNVTDMCVETGVDRMIYVSSVHALKENRDKSVITEENMLGKDAVIGLYAQTKAEATEYVLSAAERGLNASVVYPSGIVGPYDNGKGHITTLVIDYIQRRLTSAVIGGYDFVDVRDVAEGIYSCIDEGSKGEGYILSNRVYTIKEILFFLHELTGQKEIKSFLPLWFVNLTAPLCELYYKILKEPPLYTKYSLYTLSSGSFFSHGKATAAFRYGTRDMKVTLKDTVDWLAARGRI